MQDSSVTLNTANTYYLFNTKRLLPGVKRANVQFWALSHSMARFHRSSYGTTSISWVWLAT